MSKLFRFSFWISFLSVVSACVTVNKISSSDLDVLAVSETEFVIVARAVNDIQYSETELESRVINYILDDALSMGMVPVVTGKTVQTPLLGEPGYSKYTITLVEWSEAQRRLNNDCCVSGFEQSDYSDPAIFSNASGTIIEDSQYNSNEIVNVDEGTPLEQNCLNINKKYHQLLGQAMDDLCRGHSLSLELYVELEKSNCGSYSDQKEIAEQGKLQNCEASTTTTDRE